MTAFTQNSLMMYVAFVFMLNLNIKLIKLKLLRYHFKRPFGALSLKDTESLLLGVIYRSSMSSEANDVSLMEALAQARNFDAAHLLIVGDFNLPRVNWST